MLVVIQVCSGCRGDRKGWDSTRLPELPPYLLLGLKLVMGHSAPQRNLQPNLGVPGWNSLWMCLGTCTSLGVPYAASVTCNSPSERIQIIKIAFFFFPLTGLSWHQIPRGKR